MLMPETHCGRLSVRNGEAGRNDDWREDLMLRNLRRGIKEIGQYISRTYALAKPYWNSDEKWVARGLLIGLFAITVFQLSVASNLSYATADVFNALDEKAVADIWRNLGIWAALAAVMVASYVLALHVKSVLIINWRQFLTTEILARYLQKGLFNQLELKDYGIDNPDQRISMDMHNFAQETLELALSFITNLGGFIIFSVILWNVSGDLPLDVGGTTIVIPGYMFWIAVLYAGVVTWVTHKIARPLIPLNFKKQAVEADFRYHLVRLRENAESVALSEGGPQEYSSLLQKFNHIRENWLDILRYQKRLVGLHFGVNQLSGFIPYIAAMPAFLAGTIAMGGFLQLRGAFGVVEASLSWFAHSYESIAVWKASVDRILTLEDATKQAIDDRENSELSLGTSDTGNLVLDELAIKLPAGESLVGIGKASLEPGKNVIVTGQSGSGKTTLFRVLSGQWVWANGAVSRPDGALTFLPQKPYFPISTLKAALCYPDDPDSYDDERVRNVMQACRMGEFVDQLDETEDWARVLSGGEQQRLAVVRAILSKPDWLFLDESTSAMDVDTEAAIYRTLESELPNATIVSIAHRPSLKAYHDIELRLEPDTRSVSISELPGPEGLVPEPA